MRNPLAETRKVGLSSAARYGEAFLQANLGTVGESGKLMGRSGNGEKREKGGLELHGEYCVKI